MAAHRPRSFSDRTHSPPKIRNLAVVALIVVLAVSAFSVLSGPGASASRELGTLGGRAAVAGVAPLPPLPDAARLLPPLADVRGTASPSLGGAVAMTYDGADGYVVAIAPNVTFPSGTWTPGPTLDTWTFSGGHWRLLNLSSAPPNRGDAALAYDPVDQYVVLFGGVGFGPGTSWTGFLGDTWSFHNGTWTNLTGSVGSSPGPRGYAHFVWDGSDSYTLLTGGMGPSGNVTGNLTSTWSYVGKAWTQHPTYGTYPPGQGSMAYDAADGYVVYYGGGFTTGGYSNETWKFHAGNWTDLAGSVPTAPPARALAGMAYDPSVGRVLLFGGIGPGEGWDDHNDTWSYANLSWHALFNASGPAPRQVPLMAYDPPDNGTLLFGGYNQTQTFSDTWLFGPAGNGSVALPVRGFGPAASTDVWQQAGPHLSVSRDVTDVGVATSLSVGSVFAIGTVHYNYTGLPLGCTSVDSATLNCTPTGAGGIYTVHVSVTGPGIASSAWTSIQVNPRPSVGSFNASLAVDEVGVPVTLRAVVLGGTGPFAYVFSDLPTGCTSQNASAVVCTPQQAGTYPIQIAVTDVLGSTTTQALSLPVAAVPQVASLALSRPTTDVGLPTVLDVVAGGGVGALTYQYTGLPTGCPGANASTVRCVPSSSGTFEVTVSVRDSLGGHAQQLSNLIVNPWPSWLGFGVTDAAPTLGTTVTFSASATGGTGALQYSYSGLPSGCVSVDTAALSCQPSAAGNYTITATATDALGAATNTSLRLDVAPLHGNPAPHSGGGGGSGPGAAANGSPLSFPLGLGLGLIVLAVGAGWLIRRSQLARQGAELVRRLEADATERRKSRRP